MKFGQKRGFTLIELLIVIGVVAILATITLLVLNPAEMLKQGRDAKRISEIASINDALNLAVAQSPNISLGTESVLYISLPDTNSACTSWSAYLPPLLASTGWQYRCVTADNLRKNNGTGWLPVDFSGLPTSPFSNLPVDPVNAAQQGLFYSYAVTDGKWEVNVDMESSKYKWGGERDVESADNGNTIVLYEKGTDLNVMPVEANWRIGYVIGVPATCFDSTTNFSNQEYYSKWTIPGSGRVAVTKLSYYLSSNIPGGDKFIEMMMYDGISGSKISDSVSVRLNGGGARRASGTLASPVEIVLGNDYTFGLGPITSFSNSLPLDGFSDCAEYLPSQESVYVGSAGGLDNVVPAGTGLGAHAGIIGISYSL